MDVGYIILMQSYKDYGRYTAVQSGQSQDFTPAISDADIYSEGVRLAKLAEPLGFDSIWTVEHHFTPYTIIPDPVRLLTYFAACTERVNLGTMVTVLPWNDPIRVAEGIAHLDLLLEGRKFYAGFGRGAAKLEFDALRIPQAESRGLFAESVDIIRLALSGKAFSYEGKHFKIPLVELRPKPRTSAAELLERMYMAWGSAESMPVAAEMGLKPMFVPQRSWDVYTEELAEFQSIRQRAGYAPARSKCAIWVMCAPTKAEAEERARRYFWEYADSGIKHYGLATRNFENLKGYEHYASRASAFLATDDPAGLLTDMYMKTFVWGTPEMCYEKLATINDLMAPEEVMCAFQYGSMSPGDGVAEAGMRLFAQEVLPAVKKLPARSPAALARNVRATA